MAVALEGEDMGRDAVEEPAIMADDHGAARVILQRLFQRAQGIDVEIVGGFVEQQDVGPRFQHLREVNAVALAAREHADLLLLIAALEVEGAAIGAGMHRLLAEIDHLGPAGNFLPDGFLVIEAVARLIDEAELHRVAHHDRTGIRLFSTGDHAEQRGLARAVRPDDADNAARRQLEGEVLDQQLVLETLGEVLEIDDVSAEALGDGNDDLGGVRAFSEAFCTSSS